MCLQICNGGRHWPTVALTINENYVVFTHYLQNSPKLILGGEDTLYFSKSWRKIFSLDLDRIPVAVCFGSLTSGPSLLHTVKGSLAGLPCIYLQLCFHELWLVSLLTKSIPSAWCFHCHVWSEWWVNSHTILFFRRLESLVLVMCDQSQLFFSMFVLCPS